MFDLMKCVLIQCMQQLLYRIKLIGAMNVSHKLSSIKKWCEFEGHNLIFWSKKSKLTQFHINERTYMNSLWIDSTKTVYTPSKFKNNLQPRLTCLKKTVTHAFGLCKISDPFGFRMSPNTIVIIMMLSDMTGVVRLL